MGVKRHHLPTRRSGQGCARVPQHGCCRGQPPGAEREDIRVHHPDQVGPEVRILLPTGQERQPRVQPRPVVGPVVPPHQRDEPCVLQRLEQRDRSVGRGGLDDNEPVHLPAVQHPEEAEDELTDQRSRVVGGDHEGQARAVTRGLRPWHAGLLLLPVLPPTLRFDYARRPAGPGTAVGPGGCQQAHARKPRIFLPAGDGLTTVEQVMRTGWHGVGLEIDGVGDLLAGVASHLPPFYDDQQPVVGAVRLFPEAGGYALEVDGERPSRFVPAYPTLLDVANVLGLTVVERLPDLVAVHAGAVAIDGRALLLPGSTQTGKTLLVTALLERGATYLSDEFALLDEHGRVHAPVNGCSPCARISLYAGSLPRPTGRSRPPGATRSVRWRC